MRWDALGCVRIQLGGLGKVGYVFGFLAAFLDVCEVLLSSDGYFVNIRYVFQRLPTSLNGWRQVLLETGIRSRD